jgi:MoxR-like ATPase
VTGQRFFFTDDHSAPMWQIIAALSVCSATGVPLFLQGVPGSGKTEAVRHFSSNRTFRDRTPVYCVSCSTETSIEQFIGSQVFEKGGFCFVEGPLLQAASDGCVFLADEFNLLSPSVMTSLIPFLEARAGDEFSHPGVRHKVSIAPGFLFVATGNDDSECGRVKLPSFVISQFSRLEVKNPSAEHMQRLIQKIIDADYPNVTKSRLAPGQICRFISQLEQTIHVNWSLRSVRRFLRRVNDFVGFCPATQSFPTYVSPISVTDVALSFILSLPPGDDSCRNRIIVGTARCFNGNDQSAQAFARAHAEYVLAPDGHYLMRGHVAFPVDKEANFPQALLDTLFWARWCGTPTNQRLRESLLLVGPTCYKGTVLNYLLPNYTNFYDMTRETQVSELIGSTILSTQAKIRDDTCDIVRAASDALLHQAKLNENDLTRGDLAQQLGDEYRRRMGQPSGDPDHELAVGVLMGAWFIHLSMDRMTAGRKSLGGRSAVSVPGIPIVMCFVPSVVTKSVLLGIPLVLRSVHLPPASVLERLNSLLEDPRSLVLGEDTQRVFSNADIISRVTGSNSRSIPVCPGFLIAGTTSETGFAGLSRPLKSRFTYISAAPYQMSVPRTVTDRKHTDLIRITESILQGHSELMAMIEEIYQRLQELGHVKVGITEYVRWCTTAYTLMSAKCLPLKFAPGVAALRTMVDSLPDADRRRVTKDVLNDQIPVRLSYTVVTDSKERPVVDSPIELIPGSPVRLRSLVSEVEIAVCDKASVASLKSILWTQSSVDMADAVLTAVAAQAITVFEGSPGRGKTTIAYAVLQSLGLVCSRINLSPTTSAEDLFGRDIPQSAREGGFATSFVDGPLTVAMRRSADDISTDQPSQAILLDEINLASPQLLERLECFMLRMLEPGRYLLPNGKDVRHGRIVIVATMNMAALSNARSALSTKLQGASHFLRLNPFNAQELEILAGAILSDCGDGQVEPVMLRRIMEAHTIAASLLERESGTASERDAVTLREFLRFRQFRCACRSFSIEALMEMVYATQFGTRVAAELLSKLGFSSKFNATKPIIHSGRLLLTDAVSLPVWTESQDGPAQLPLTVEQRRVACLVAAGVMAHRPVALFGESGSGKTHIVRALAQVLGAPISVIQFHSDTDSASIVGSLEIDGDAVQVEKLRKDIWRLTDLLIQIEHPLSLELANMALEDDADLSVLARILRQILTRASEDPSSIRSDILVELKRLNNAIQRFLAQSVQNFVFKEGPLLKRVRQGGWVLLDGVDAAPHEVERLMSLLEEDPTLAVYEGVAPLRFVAKRSRLVRRIDLSSSVREQLVEISHEFQIFITCRDPRKLSPALRSRCFCVHIESPSGEDGMKELAESVLMQYGGCSPYHTPLSKLLSRALAIAQRANRHLLFSKDTFSAHRVVNCARGLGTDRMTGDSIAHGLCMSFVACFSNQVDQDAILAEIRTAVQALASEKIPLYRSGWEELTLQAGRLEFAAIYDACPRDSWPDAADKSLGQLFCSVNPDNFRVLTLPEAPNNVNTRSMMAKFEASLLDWIGGMTIGDVKRTVGVLEEVKTILTAFHELCEPALTEFFRILLLLDVLRPAADFSGLDYGQSEVLCRKRIDMEGFKGLANENRSAEECAAVVVAVQHLYATFRSLPSALHVMQVLKGVLSMALEVAYSGFSFSSSRRESGVLVGLPGLRRFLRHIEVTSSCDDTASLVRPLAQSERLVRVCHISERSPTIDDFDSIHLVVGGKQGLIARHGSKEYNATLEAMADILLPLSEIPKPWAKISLDRVHRTDVDGLCRVPALTPEQRLWILTCCFRGVPAEFLTSNVYLRELIEALRKVPNPVVSSKIWLTALGPDHSARA